MTDLDSPETVRCGKLKKHSELRVRKPTPEMERQKLLKSNGHDIRRSSLLCEEMRNLKCWSKPVHEVLLEASYALQVCVVGCDLD